MMIRYISVSVLCLWVGVSTAQVLAPGRCPDIPVQQDFDLNRYLGRWYEQKKFFAIFQTFSRNVTAEYTLQADGRTVTVNNTGFDRWEEGYVTDIGKAVSPESNAKLEVSFNDATPGRYWVLDTDYTGHTVVWSCTEQDVGPVPLNAQLTWILTRKPEGLDSDVMDNLLKKIADKGIKIENFMNSFNTKRI